MKPKVHLWSYLVIFFSDLQNIRENFINHNRHFILNEYFISKSCLLWNYVEQYRTVRPDTDDYDTCSLHGGNLRLQHALRLCNIYCCPAASNVVITILIFTAYVEPSALEVVVRGIISSLLSFLIRLSSVDWPSWRSERHGHCFPRFPPGKRHLYRSLLFLLLLWSLRLGFKTPTLFLPGAGARRSLFSCFLPRETYSDVVACPEGKSLVLVFVFF